MRTPTISAKNKSDWKHLQDLGIPDCRGGEVELLLGANCLEAVLQTEARVGQRGQPIAVRTAFGWSLTGSIAGSVPLQVSEVMFIQKDEQELSTSLQDWWSTEAFGTKFAGETLCSEDAKAMRILEKTTLKTNRHNIFVSFCMAQRNCVPWHRIRRSIEEKHNFTVLFKSASS